MGASPPLLPISTTYSTNILDRLEQAFVVQTVSRFAVAYLLTTHGFLAPNASCLSVANVGQSLDDLDVDDLSLRAAFESGKRYKVGLFMDQSKRDSSVLDAFHAVSLNASFLGARIQH